MLFHIPRKTSCHGMDQNGLFKRTQTCFNCGGQDHWPIVRTTQWAIVLSKTNDHFLTRKSEERSGHQFYHLFPGHPITDMIGRTIFVAIPVAILVPRLAPQSGLSRWTYVQKHHTRALLYARRGRGTWDGHKTNTDTDTKVAQQGIYTYTR